MSVAIVLDHPSLCKIWTLYVWGGLPRIISFQKGKERTETKRKKVLLSYKLYLRVCVFHIEELSLSYPTQTIMPLP